MVYDIDQLVQALLRHATYQLSRYALLAIAHLLAGTLTLIVLAAAIASLTYAATYRDASGASCVAFNHANHEVDLCYGRIDR